MNIKRIFTVAALLIIVGLIFLLAGLFMVGFDTTELSTEKYEARTETFAGKINEIEIDDSNTPVLLYATDGDLRVECFESENSRYNITLDGGKLHIEKIEKIKLLNLSLDFVERTLTVYIPTYFSGELVIDTSNAKIVTENITSENAKLYSSNGKINASDCDFGELDARTSNSSINIEKVFSPGKLTLTSSNGDISLNSVKSESLKVRTSTGQISVNKTDSQSLELKTSNGRITGTLQGTLADYRITSKTSNGSNSLPSSTNSGTRELKAETSNSDINLSFE